MTAYEQESKIRGLWKFSIGNQPSLISRGEYADPVLSDDGNWLVAAKAEKNWAPPNGVVCMDMLGKGGYGIEATERDIGITPADNCSPVCFIKELGKYLIYRCNEYQGPAYGDGPEYYLFDPDKRSLQRIHGNVAPYFARRFDEFQKSDKENEVWAFVNERKSKMTGLGIIGRYNPVDFVFDPKLVLEDVYIEDIWIDEGIALVLYEDMVLEVPISE